jgi:hypothetical protein
MPIYQVTTKEVCINTYEVAARSKEDAISSYYEQFNSRQIKSVSSDESVISTLEVFPTDELSR